jgi:hypothetical protein
MPKFTGGCLCGAVRYEANAEPALVAVCHCVTCQKNTGSSYSFNLGMPADAVSITGDGKVSTRTEAGPAASLFTAPSVPAADRPSPATATPIPGSCSSRRGLSTILPR